jgi:DNA-directed RNA polymerase specialized sigma24 family protein
MSEPPATSSISDWLPALAAGDQVAAQRLWENYFAQMVRLAAGKLQGIARRAADEEDVALSAFDSFCQGLQAGRFPQLADRHDLWRLLVVLTARKAADMVQHGKRQKRGGGHVRGDSALAGESNGVGWEQVVGREPTPEFSCQVREQMSELLSALNDPTLQAIALAKLEGHTNEEIAARLNVVPRTIERKLVLIRRRWQPEVPP